MTTKMNSEKPRRQLGRVNDEHWDLIKTAAAKSGRNFTEWALSILVDAAKKNHPGFDMDQSKG